jgi:uncharacterized membrane protein YkvA (DUF1232 family)
MDKKHLDTYAKRFSVPAFWAFLSRNARRLGLKVAYAALLMFYAYNRKETPRWARRIVLGSLGYLLTPLDALPDLTPFVGYTDDLGILSFGLVTIAAYVNEEVKKQARGRLRSWFGSYDEGELAVVDNRL